MKEETYRDAMDWLAANPDKWECDVEIELLVPIDQVPACVVEYLKTIPEKRKFQDDYFDTCEQLGLNDDF